MHAATVASNEGAAACVIGAGPLLCRTLGTDGLSCSQRRPPDPKLGAHEYRPSPQREPAVPNGHTEERPRPHALGELRLHRRRCADAHQLRCLVVGDVVLARVGRLGGFCGIAGRPPTLEGSPTVALLASRGEGRQCSGSPFGSRPRLRHRAGRAGRGPPKLDQVANVRAPNDPAAQDHKVLLVAGRWAVAVQRHRVRLVLRRKFGRLARRITTRAAALLAHPPCAAHCLGRLSAPARTPAGTPADGLQGTPRRHRPRSRLRRILGQWRRRCLLRHIGAGARRC
mmetsp:Transcript_125579/g.361057  ORF Transcript_125579/g.361057 Transcript_125579/m.361057 type:complete len:284 (-) Transcript_125579:149-1000(-)